MTDLHRDSEDEGTFLDAGDKIFFPCRVNTHFPIFVIKHRKTEAIEDVKRVLSSLEKDALLLDLIPIAFNDDLETQVQLNGLFTDKVNSLSTIWDFTVISFKLFGELEGLQKYFYDLFQRLDKYFVQHSSLLVEDYESIIDVFRFCVDKNENLKKCRNIEHSKPDDNTNRLDMDIVMEDTVWPRALSAQGSTSLVDLILSPPKYK